MLSRRAATRAGRKLNEIADHLNEKTVEGLRVSRLLTEREASEATEAIRVANEIMYQYFCIPRSVREEWYREGGDLSGLPMQDLSEV